MDRKLFVALFILIILALAFFVEKSLISKRESSSGQPSKFQIVASFYPLYFFSTQIVKDKAEVINITPASAEPHDYEPTAQDIAKIENSQLLILNGGKLEAWGDNIKNNLKGTKVKVITVGEGLTTKQVTEGGNTSVDPHIWLSPKLAKQEVEKITQNLVQADPESNLYFTENQNQLETRLDQIDQDYKQGLKNCQQKAIVTSHAAFGYLASDYGLTQVSISGFSPDEEPSPQKLAEVAKFVKDKNIKYLLFESLVSPKLSQTIARETGAQTLVLNPIEGLSDDEIKQGKDYFSEMRQNLKNLQTALECSQ